MCRARSSRRIADMITRRRTSSIAAAAALFLACCAAAPAATLATATLDDPLVPGHRSRLSLPMPKEFAPDQEVWVGYELLARSTGDDGEREIGIEQSFEGVVTPALAAFTTFSGDRMQTREAPGGGQLLGGRLLRRLPPPGTPDATLLVSVERASGMQPVALKVTVGQGSLPPQFQQKPEDSLAYKAGYLAGLAAFGWLVVRLFRRRRD